MSDLLRACRELLAYTIWADRIVLDALRQVSAADLGRDTGSSFGSVTATIVHVLAAEQRWLARFLGSPQPSPPDPYRFTDRLTLALEFEDLWPQLEFFIASLTEAQLPHELSWVTPEGEERTRPLWQAILHFANHSTFHRGQVVSQLRQLGYSAPETDFIRFSIERPAVAGEGLC